MSEVNSTTSYTKTFAVGVGAAALAQLLMVGVNKLGYANIGRWSYAVSAGLGTIAAAGYHFSSKPGAPQEDKKAAQASTQILGTTQQTDNTTQSSPQQSVGEKLERHTFSELLYRGEISVAEFDTVMNLQDEQQFKKALLLNMGAEKNVERAREWVDYAAEKGWLNEPIGDGSLLTRCQNTDLIPYLIEKGANPFLADGRQVTALSRFKRTDELEPVLTAALTYGDQEEAKAWLTAATARPTHWITAQNDKERNGKIAKCVFPTGHPSLLAPLVALTKNKKPFVSCGNPARSYPLAHAAVILCRIDMAREIGDLTTEFDAKLEGNRIKAQSPFFHLFYTTLKDAQQNGGQLNDVQLDMMRWLSEQQAVDKKGHDQALAVLGSGARPMDQQLREFLGELAVRG